MTDAEMATEREANLFARELLVPRVLLRKEMKKLDKQSMGFSTLDDEALKVLARKFDVPMAVIVDQVRRVYEEDRENAH